MRTLPDLLRPGLDLVFAGINPGERSAAEGHYYAHPGNGFWPALSASALVAEVVGPQDDRRLPAAYRIGFTDVVKRVVTDSTTVTDAELRAAAPAFFRRVAYARPRAVCLTSTRAYRLLFPEARVAGGWAEVRWAEGRWAEGRWAEGRWGRQPLTLAGAAVWVMPSTSGRAAGYRAHVHRVLAELAESLGREPRSASRTRGAA